MGAIAPLRVRPFEDGDLDRAAAVSAAAFGLDVGEEADAVRWRGRVEHSVATDPGGAFVAARAGRIVGVAQAIRRERLWCLSLLAVAPGAQSAGAGRALLERALGYGDPAGPALIVSSNDPRALALYARAGFRLLPTVEAEGIVDRSRLPAPALEVSEQREPDLDRLAPISREIRGAPHTEELAYALRRGARLLVAGDRGFVAVQEGYGIWLLVARDDTAAASLLSCALDALAGGAPARVRWLTAEQQWAIRIAADAGLRLTAHGALCVRGSPGPLHPFVPSGPFA